MTTTSAGSTATPYCAAVMRRRSPVAAARCRAHRYIRSAHRRSARRAASSTAVGRRSAGLADFEMNYIGAGGLRSLAARRTSIAIKGGTSPRRDARIVMPGRILPA